MTTFYEFTKLKFSNSPLLTLTVWTGIGDYSRLTKEFNQMIAMRTRFPTPSVETRGSLPMGFFPYLILETSTFDLINLCMKDKISKTREQYR